MNTKIELDAHEYARREAYCNDIKSMHRSEYIEIARILQKHNIDTSENRSGVFFDAAKLPQDVFEELLQLHEFVRKNTKELEKRDTFVASKSKT
jgi:hypothetical protein